MKSALTLAARLILLAVMASLAACAAPGKAAKSADEHLLKEVPRSPALTVDKGQTREGSSQRVD
jgi:hypothetical protein